LNSRHGRLDRYAGLTAGAQAAEVTPVRRVGQPDDIAAAICFLASEEAGFVTGQTLYVDGGRRL